MRKSYRNFNMDELLANVLGTELFKKLGLIISLPIPPKINTD
jgi:hypothetical protein